MRIKSDPLDVKLSMMISKTDHDRLDALETKRQESRSDVVRKAIRAYLTKEENRK
jgi:metal-responsive CopG/Arc/MetJ family transcriptional regulator